MTRQQFEEAVRFAVEKEEEAAALYESAQRVAVTELGKKTFAEFAAEERKHKKMLLQLRVESIEDKALVAVPNLKISDYLVEVEFEPDMSYQDMLILAMKREEQSLRLYTELQKHARDAQLQKLFSLLAQEEARHKLRLETMYDEEVLSEN